jgi:hypothetical protein
VPVQEFPLQSRPGPRRSAALVRFLGSRRPAFWLGAVCALTGLGLEFVGAGRTAPTTTTDSLWHDIGAGLLVLAVAAPLPIWRRVEREQYAGPRPVKAWERVTVRAVAIVLLLFPLMVIVGWILQLHGQVHAADALYIVGALCVPAALLVGLGGMILLANLPIALRRPEITAELTKALYPTSTDRLRLNRGGKTSTDVFDPNLGATGRPAPAHESPGAAPSAEPYRIEFELYLRGTCTLGWTGSRFTVVGPDSRSRPEIPGGPDGPAEMVWCQLPTVEPRYTRNRKDHIRNVYLLDSAGYALVAIRGVESSWGNFGKLAKHSGVPYRVYKLRSLSRAERRVDRLLFPRRRGCVRIR